MYLLQLLYYLIEYICLFRYSVESFFVFFSLNFSMDPLAFPCDSLGVPDLKNPVLNYAFMS